MKKMPFKSSSIASIGVELEIQIVNPITFDLKAGAKDLMRIIKKSEYQNRVKPEITQSMIEINSSIHLSPLAMYEEILEIKSFLFSLANNLGIFFSGGGTHPFQKWELRKIFPTKRFKNLSKIYRYLSKRSTVFGEHIHIGCSSGEEALYLTHALSRFVPQLIALSASSPFYQGLDTGYHSTRTNIFNAFPLSGYMPFFTNWTEFSNYFYKMRGFGIVNTMKDFYWDIRPKPEFGTVEVRVCDMPLTLQKSISLVAYLQSLSLYLLQERPLEPLNDLYLLYNYNRFQASRYGFEGDFIDPYTSQRFSILDDILATAEKIEKYAKQLNNFDYFRVLMDDAVQKKNDASLLRQIVKQVNSLPLMVNEQCKLWEK